MNEVISAFPEQWGRGSVKLDDVGCGVHDWSHYFRVDERSSLAIFADADRLATAAGPVPELAHALGYRLLDQSSLSDAVQSLSRLIDVDAVLVICRGDEPALDMLLARLDMMAGTYGTGLAVITDFVGVDRVHAAVQSADAVILCRPSPEDIVTALAVIREQELGRTQLSDIGNGENADIMNLSDQLARLNHAVEALVQIRLRERRVPEERQLPVPKPTPPDLDLGNGGPAHLTAHQVRAVLRVRRLREHIVATDLFADPAWDIMLDLMAARLENVRVSVSSLCIAAAVPPTTALRWIRQLTEKGLLKREADPDDGRRIFIALTDEGASAVERWFHESRSWLMASFEPDRDGTRGAKPSY
ncbi:MAG: winged helix DNA-binding protein [Sphingobium sp.]